MAEQVDSGAPSAVMWSIGQIAERDGVSKQATSKTVKRLVDDNGLEHERDGRGRIVAVNVAAYDRLREKFGDPTRRQAPDKAEAPARSLDSFEEARRQGAWITAERDRLALAEQKGELVRVAGVVEAAGEAAQEIVRIVDRLPQAADDIAAACGRDGTHGVRVVLKQMAQKMREDVANALAIVAGNAPELEESQEVEAAAAE